VSTERSPSFSTAPATSPSKQKRSSSLLYRTCLCGSVVYCCVVAALFWSRTSGTQAYSPVSGTALALLDEENPEALCLAARQPKSLLVEVPFTQSDAASLEIAVSLWEQTWPCYRKQPSRPDLLLAFNGNLSEPDHAGLMSRLRAVTARRVIRECFGRVTIESAYLSGADDTYDKRRLTANWTVGPNNLFVHFLELAAARGYRYMAQLEPDVFPLRPLWLEQMQCLATHSSAWVLGSPFLSLCAHDSKTRRCQELGDTIRFHINGNALYAVGDAAFRAYWARAFAGKLSLWPFDLALHLYARTLPEAAQRRLAIKLRPHPFILNYGAEPLTASAAAAMASSQAVTTDAAVTSLSRSGSNTSRQSGALSAPRLESGALPMLRRASTNTYLVHSSWGMAQLRTRGAQGFAALGLADPSGGQLSNQATKAVVEDSGAMAPPADIKSPLLRLARTLSDSEDRLILTFVTKLYDPLCRNFVAHLRRIRLRNYLLTTFTASYHRELEARGEQPYLHELPSLTSDGSDVFASHDFFLINSARYSVLTMLLRAGIHVFSLDLDVVLLRNPLPFVWQLPFDLLLQSDARDAASLSEASPYLLRDRLHLPNTTSRVTYVNGGVFFARGTTAVARLFEDTWSMASQDLGGLNEQDCLNRMLIVSSLRWAPLPPYLFPNGYVYFRRPVRDPPPSRASSLRMTATRADVEEGSSSGPVLVHCNWINGIAAKRFLLREALLWTGDDARDSSRANGRLLVYSMGNSAEERTLGAQMHAFAAALALATQTNRTLVLPSFFVIPNRRHAAVSSLEVSLSGSTLVERAFAEARDAANAGRRGFTYLFEYAALLRYFPDHRESSVLRMMPQLPLSEILPMSDELNRQTSPATGGGIMDAAEPAREEGEFTESLPAAFFNTSEREGGLSRWLTERQAMPILHINGLHRARIRELLLDSSQLASFAVKLRMALKPAPELRVISHHIVTKIQSHISAARNQNAHQQHVHQQQSTQQQHAHHSDGAHRRMQHAKHASGRNGAGLGRRPLFAGESESESKKDYDAEFGGLTQMIGDGVSEGTGVGAASHNSHNMHGGYMAASRNGFEHVEEFNCIHVTRAELASVERLEAAAAPLSLTVPTLLVQEIGEPGREATHHERDSVGSNWLREPLPASAASVFTAPLHVGDFYPYWDEVEVHDETLERTLAYDLVQQLVCSAARRVQGSTRSTFVRGVCHWRESRALSSTRTGTRAASGRGRGVSGLGTPAAARIFDVCSNFTRET
jgi:hypothetical protein